MEQLRRLDVNMLPAILMVINGTFPAPSPRCQPLVPIQNRTVGTLGSFQLACAAHHERSLTYFIVNTAPLHVCTARMSNRVTVLHI